MTDIKNLPKEGDKVDNFEILKCCSSWRPLLKIVCGQHTIFAKINEPGGVSNYNCQFESDLSTTNGCITIKAINHEQKEIKLKVSKEFYDTYFSKHYKLE